MAETSSSVSSKSGLPPGTLVHVGEVLATETRTSVIDYTVDAAYIDPAKCQGCGVCVSECPAKAITLKNFTDSQIIAQETAMAAG